MFLECNLQSSSILRDRNIYRTLYYYWMAIWLVLPFRSRPTSSILSTLVGIGLIRGTRLDFIIEFYMIHLLLLLLTLISFSKNSSKKLPLMFKMHFDVQQQVINTQQYPKLYQTRVVMATMASLPIPILAPIHLFLQINLMLSATILLFPNCELDREKLTQKKNEFFSTIGYP